MPQRSAKRLFKTSLTFRRNPNRGSARPSLPSSKNSVSAARPTSGVAQKMAKLIGKEAGGCK